MQSLHVNGFDMPYLEVGDGPPLICVHGSLGDFRVWWPVMGPLSAKRRIISVSLRRFFPEHWDGVGGRFSIDQHVADLIAFLEAFGETPIDLMGHSRGGHISYRVAEQRPDLLRKAVLAEPGGMLDESFGDQATGPGVRSHIDRAAAKIAEGDVEGGLRVFEEAIDGDGAWDRLPMADRQARRDNVYTFLAQIHEGRRPFAKADVENVQTPTLLIGGADTTGTLSVIWRVLGDVMPNAETAVIPNARHFMFVDQPQAYSEAVLNFL